MRKQIELGFSYREQSVVNALRACVHFCAHRLFRLINTQKALFTFQIIAPGEIEDELRTREKYKSWKKSANK
jgi:hypothetical protein